ncbi:MAG: VWA domain-containing protein [Clostridia bacterium]|nr:VWA domain-containing protein [Clostridia bacterium]
MLHLIIMVLSISVLSGMTFSYDEPNTENEVIVLIDTSFSGDETESDKNSFIEDVINSTDSMYKLGVVTFGYDQVYAVELTTETDGVFGRYLSAAKPDNSATDIASALSYTSELFSRPESARIVLISDGVETDSDAATVIKQVAAKGIKVDTVHFPAEKTDNEVLITGVNTPDYNIRVGEEFELELLLRSSYEGTAVVTLMDTGTITKTISVELTEGEQSVKIPATFTRPDMHELSFNVESSADTLTQNNTYNTFIYLEVFDQLLVIESIDGESTALRDMLKDDYDVTVVNVADEEKMPRTLDQLREFDEIILVNISNDDMPDGFDEILYSYVHDIGGGLFTVCGNEVDSNPSDAQWEANAYTKDDMYGTIYQDMLPVEAINYTPPVAVMIVIDRSGSMWDKNTPYEDSPLYAAKLGAEACLDALTERDYVGIMSLSDYYDEEVELTPRPQKAKIISAINDIELGEGTIFEGALSRARSALTALSSVERRHIILVTDGMPGDPEPQLYLDQAKLNAEAGITMSVIGINCTYTTQQAMVELLEEAGGTAENFHDVKDIQKVPTAMREDLLVPEIKDVNYETFTPTIKTFNSVVSNIMQADMPTLDGFYGMKAKVDKGAEVVLMGEYVPIYTQWKYGAGMVGTFACDLNGTWSSDFIGTPTAITLVNNIVMGLFPSESIRKSDIELEITSKNYTTQLSIFTELAEGNTLEVKVTSPSPDGGFEPVVSTYTPGVGSTYSRINLVIKNPGMHEITVIKKDEVGNVVSDATIYKSFSYSEEYNTFFDNQASEQFMSDLAKSGNGTVIETDNPWQIFENVVKYLHHTIDPRIVFIIIALVLFLLDIAARKFKFKWPNEIIQDYKARKSLLSK